MGLLITDNISSLIAQNSVNSTSNSLATSLQRLSTGLKINSGADGPAALVISQEQLGQIAGLQTAIDNTSKATSLVQTAEGALGTINDLLTQIRSIAIDSANNGVQDANALAANQAQISNALDTIDRIANNTQFGTKKLLDGSAGITATTAVPGFSVSGTAGSAAPSGTYTLAVTAAAVKANANGGQAYDGTQFNTTNGTLTVNNVAITLTKGNAGTLDQAINTINSYSSQTGVVASRDATTGTNLVLSSVKYGTAGNFTVTADTAANAATGFSTTATTTSNGADPTGTFVDTASNSISLTAAGNTFTAEGLSITLGDSATPFTSVDNGGTAAPINVTNNTLVFQIGANANQTASIGINDVRTTSLGQNTVGVTTGVSSLNGINVTTAAGAQDAIRVIDNAASQVSNQRGALGAFQSNTLQQTASNLTATLTNTTAAESVIRDTNFAQETANYTKDQVLLQVGTTVLANSNALNQLVLNLFK
jgi:flagellin